MDKTAKELRSVMLYDQLYQSVLCGIIQYKVRSDGNFIFISANPMAIRIMGYDEKEFWDKKFWQIEEFSADDDISSFKNHISALREGEGSSDYEYKIRRKDGTSRWLVGADQLLRGDDGELFYQTVFLDNHERKQAELENKMLLRFDQAKNEILSLVLDNSSVFDFSCCPKEHSVHCSPRMMEYYHLPEYIEDGCKFLDEHAWDKGSWNAQTEICDKIMNLKGHATIEYVDIKQRWNKITISAIDFDENGMPSYAVGIVEDITKTKKLEAALEEAHSYDDITGLYTKDAGIKKVRTYMEHKKPAQVCAMMILDMDGFKQVNQEEGRVFADILLRETADILRSHIGKDDIAVRLGGDEFLLFIKDCDKARATVIGPAIAAAIQGFKYNCDKVLSASIGMCVTAVVNEYSGLYRCAESTLQYVKSHGKGYAACYLDTSNVLGTWLIQMYPQEHLLNTIDSTGKYSEENLADVALELLGKARRLEDAINLLSAKIGKRYGLDRVSVMDINEEYKNYNYTYQWAKKNTDLKTGKTFYFKEGELEKLESMYNEHGFFIENKSVEGNPASSLNFAIWSDGQYVGNYRFESFNQEFDWTDESKKVFKEITQIVSTFVMKARADAVSKAKTDFLSRMSHEIRTPMNAISGMTQIAKNTLGDREKTLDCLTKIERSNQYLLKLINDILEMSRVESGKTELNRRWLLLQSLEQELEEILKGQAEGREISLNFESTYPKNWFVFIDPLRFNQILINIIGNAVKFTNPGGKIIVSLTLIEINNEIAHIRFSVKDNGVGIPQDAIKRIFNTFEQENRNTALQYGGTGLGLTISSNFVRLMGGVLEVESELGKGSEFYFTLPLLYREKSTDINLLIGEAKDIVNVFDFTGKRLLIVEDNELNLEIITTLLKEHGFILEEATNGANGLNAFLEHEAGYYSGILMDVRMPVMDGLEATRQIRLSGKADARSIPIIAMTANAFDEDAQKSIQSGMNGHLSKPLEMGIVLKTLEKCLNNQDLV